MKRQGIVYTLWKKSSESWGALVDFLKEQKADFWLLRFVDHVDVFHLGNYIVLAQQDDELLGVFSVKVGRHKAQTYGTYVTHRMRRQGVAATMWRFAVRELDVRKVSCGTISKEGAGFARAMQQARKTFLVDHYTI